MSNTLPTGSLFRAHCGVNSAAAAKTAMKSIWRLLLNLLFESIQRLLLNLLCSEFRACCGLDLVSAALPAGALI